MILVTLRVIDIGNVAAAQDCKTRLPTARMSLQSVADLYFNVACCCCINATMHVYN